MLRKATVLANVIAQVTTGHQIDDEVKVIAILISKVHVDEETKTEIAVKRSIDHLRMVELAEELLLVHDGVDTTFRDDASLGHFLHREEFLFLPQLDFPDLAETASSNDIAEVEVVLVYLYNDHSITSAHLSTYIGDYLFLTRL